MKKPALLKRMFTNRLNMGFPLLDWVKKTVYEVETHWLPWKEKVLGAELTKGDADRVLRHKRTHPYWFPWKRCNCKQCFQLPSP